MVVFLMVVFLMGDLCIARMCVFLFLFCIFFRFCLCLYNITDFVNPFPRGLVYTPWLNLNILLLFLYSCLCISVFSITLVKLVLMFFLRGVLEFSFFSYVDGMVMREGEKGLQVLVL